MSYAQFPDSISWQWPMNNPQWYGPGGEGAAEHAIVGGFVSPYASDKLGDSFSGAGPVIPSHFAFPADAPKGAPTMPSVSESAHIPSMWQGNGLFQVTPQPMYAGAFYQGAYPPGPSTFAPAASTASSTPPLDGARPPRPESTTTTTATGLPPPPQRLRPGPKPKKLKAMMAGKAAAAAAAAAETSRVDDLRRDSTSSSAASTSSSSTATPPETPTDPTFWGQAGGTGLGLELQRAFPSQDVLAAMDVAMTGPGPSHSIGAECMIDGRTGHLVGADASSSSSSTVDGVPVFEPEGALRKEDVEKHIIVIPSHKAISATSSSGKPIKKPGRGGKHWQCALCKAIFPRRSATYSHVQTHLGDRPYKCHVGDCGMSFVRQHDLRRHVKIHMVEKENVCPCGSAFARRDALARHRSRGICIGSTVPRKNIGAT